MIFDDFKFNKNKVEEEFINLFYFIFSPTKKKTISVELWMKTVDKNTIILIINQLIKSIKSKLFYKNYQKQIKKKKEEIF